MKKITLILAIILLFSLSGCKNETATTAEPDTEVVEPAQAETPEIQEEPLIEEEAVEIQDDENLPTVDIAWQEGEASYHGYTLTYSIASPVLQNFPEEAATIIEAYYENLAEKYVSYLENEAVYQLETMAWDGEYAYNFGCQAVYVGDDMVSFIRSVSEPSQDYALYSETFSLENGGLITLEYLFGSSGQDYRQMILDYIIGDISNNDELLPQMNQENPDWQQTLSDRLDLDQFIVTETGISIYFQHSQLGVNMGFSIDIPWENLPETEK